ncbi:unnamed protein product, partial [Symbiodinium pilosum]
RWTGRSAARSGGNSRACQSECRDYSSTCGWLLASATVLSPRTDFFRRLRRISRRSGERVIPLLPDEAGSVMMVPSITTVTFYEGDPPTSILRDMTQTLLAANPWLGGRLRRDRSTGTTVLCMPVDPPNIDTHFI